MNLLTIDKHYPVPELTLYLAKPDREIIGNMSEAYNRVGKFDFDGLNEISFTLPKFIYKDSEKTINKNYENILDRYLVKVEYGLLISEWFMVTEIVQETSNIPEKTVTIQSLQVELNNKLVRNYKVDTVNPNTTISELLVESTWSLGEIDSELTGVYRSFDESNSSVLQVLYTLSEKYNGILIFDTELKTVSLKKQENIEVDLGLTLSYGKYIKTVSSETNSVEMATRISVYGKDNISIRNVNPTGMPYLEDFSYFIRGFETDEKGEVVSSSPYMSDDLCLAILAYNKLIDSKEQIYFDFLEELKPLREGEIKREGELRSLNTELDIIRDSLDINKAMGDNTTELEKSEADKLVEIIQKEEQLKTINEQVKTLQAKIESLQQEISIQNNFTEEQIKERDYYIIEAEWTDENYFDETDLYEMAKEKLAKTREPQRELNFSLVQFLNLVESQKDWSRIGLGYTIRVNYKPFDIETESIISKIDIGFDSNDLDITVSNVKYKSSEQKFAELLQTTISSSQRVSMDSLKWNESANKATKIEQMLEGTWDAADRRITAGVNESVDISRRGIVIKNPKFPNEVIVMQSGVLALSKDGGQNWKTAITPDGIIAEKLVGRIIAGQNLIIENESGELRFDEEGLTVARQDGMIKTYLNATDGIKIQRKFEKGFEDVFYADVDGYLYARGLIIDDTSTIGGYTVDDLLEGVTDIDDGNIVDTIPRKPTSVTASGAYETIMVEWDFDHTIALSHYEVHASKEINFLPSELTLVYKGKTGRYSHKGKTNETWYFRVRGVNTHNRAGSYSDQASASTQQIFSDDILFGEIKAEHLENNLDIADKLAQNTVDRINEEAIRQGKTYTDEELKQARQNIIDHVDGQVGGINNNITELEDTTTNLIERANSTDNAMDDKLDTIDYTRDKTGILSSIESNRLDIDANAEGLDLRVTKEEYDNLEIGGRNLILNSKEETAGSRQFFKYISTGLAKGNYIFSFYMKANRDTRAIVYLNDNTGKNRVGWHQSGIGLTSAYQKFEVPFKLEHTDGVSHNNVGMSVYGREGDLLTGKLAKLEKGTKVTDWTPAPEDTQTQIDTATERISSTEATLDIHAGQISAKAERSELVNYVGKQEYRVQVGDFNVSFEEINSSVSDTKAVVDEHTGEIKSAKQDISNVVQRAGRIESNVSSIGTELDGTKEIVNANSTRIRQLPNEIDLSVREGIGDLEIGGRNLFRNGDLATKDLSHWSNNGDVTYARVDNLNAIRLRGTHRGFYQTPQKLGHDIYTISFKAKSIGNSSSIQVGFLNSPNDGRSRTFVVDSQEWRQYVFTTKTKLPLLGLFHFYANGSTGQGLYITDIKIEKGTKATDWTPAPEDQVNKTNVLSSIRLSKEGLRLHGRQIHLDGQSLIDDAVIGTAAIANLAVTNAKMARLSVGTAQIQDASIVSAKIGKLAVDTAHINDLAITNAKVGSLSADKLTSGSIDAGKIRVYNLSASEIKTGTLDANLVSVSNLSADSITSGSIDASEIRVYNLSASNIKTGTLDAINITGSIITGGMITSNTDIRVTTDIHAGHNLFLGYGKEPANTNYLGIMFGSSPYTASIAKQGRSTGLDFEGTRFDFHGKVHMPQGLSVTGTIDGTAHDSQRLGGVLASSYARSNHSHSWGQITGKPSTFTPSSHSHSWGQITGKPSTFNPSSHNHDGRYIRQMNNNNGYIEITGAGNLNIYNSRGAWLKTIT